MPESCGENAATAGGAPLQWLWDRRRASVHIGAVAH
jgi:hypothetical protein